MCNVENLGSKGRLPHSLEKASTYHAWHRLPSPGGRYPFMSLKDLSYHCMVPCCNLVCMINSMCAI